MARRRARASACAASWLLPRLHTVAKTDVSYVHRRKARHRSSAPALQKSGSGLQLAKLLCPAQETRARLSAQLAGLPKAPEHAATIGASQRSRHAAGRVLRAIEAVHACAAAPPAVHRPPAAALRRSVPSGGSALAAGPAAGAKRGARVAVRAAAAALDAYKVWRGAAACSRPCIAGHRRMCARSPSPWARRPLSSACSLQPAECRLCRRLPTVLPKACPATEREAGARPGAAQHAGGAARASRALLRALGAVELG